jgi:putative colanic acid biosynthesis acetyltransferase WcaB
MGTHALIRADLAANDEGRGKLCMVLFRLASAKDLPRLVRAPFVVLYRVLVNWVFGVELPVGTQVGPGLTLNHATGLVVNVAAKIGAGCDLKHGCTVGQRRAGGPSPVLGDGVVLGAGAHVVGGITLGDGAEVGAGAVVLQDVPAGHIAVGNPARVLPRVRS